MLGGAPDLEVQRFRELIAHVLGLRLDDVIPASIAGLLAARMRARGCASFDDYERVLHHSLEETGEIARHICVNETHLLRHGDQFNALQHWLRRRAETHRPLRLLSAGCASGEEAFSIAITAHQAQVPLDANCISILGVDLDPDALGIAQKGCLSKWSLREVPPTLRDRYSTPAGRGFRLSPCIRDAVTFRQDNLLRPHSDLWRPASWDVVFCRNVLMYFTPEGAAAVVRNIAEALVDGGLLFLGHAETLRGLSTDFEVVQGPGAFLYERRPRQGSPRPRARWDVPHRWNAADDWVREIATSSERIERLSRAPLPPSIAPISGSDHAEKVGRDGLDLQRAMELFREERFGEALAALDAGRPGLDPRRDASLLRAVLLVNGGQVEAAERECDSLLSRSELDAPSHYVKALCRESAGDSINAARHDRIAISLDPGFAMPQLHLGMLSRRSGDLATARRALRRACGLLEHEDSQRVALFGGGFGRETLVSLCRSEIAACEARP